MLATRVWNADDRFWRYEHAWASCQSPATIFRPGPVPPQYLMERHMRLGGWIDEPICSSPESTAGCGRAAAERCQSERFPIAELNLIGHNLANVLAALLLMRGSGLASHEQARTAARVHALPHRMQLVAQAAGVGFDDSKAPTSMPWSPACTASHGRWR